MARVKRPGTPGQNYDPDWKPRPRPRSLQPRDTPCPICRKKVRGQAGLENHIKEMHEGDPRDPT